MKHEKIVNNTETEVQWDLLQKFRCEAGNISMLQHNRIVEIRDLHGCFVYSFSFQFSNLF